MNYRPDVAAGRSRDRSRRSGSYNVLIALLLPSLLALVALGIDIGTIVMSQRQLQDAVDAAAIAGASSSSNGAEAERRAALTASYSKIPPYITVERTNLDTGTYDPGTNTFQRFTDVPNGVAVDADASVALTFGSFVGYPTVNISATGYAWYVAFDCQIYVDNLADLGGTVIGDGWNSCEETAYTTGTEPISFCSNGSFDLNGSVNYDGDLNPGPTGSVTMGGSSSYTGDSTNLTYEIELPNFENDSLLASLLNDNGRLSTNLTVAGKRDVTIGPGTYYFNNLTITGDATLYLQPPIDVYVDGKLFVAGDGEIRTNGTNSAQTTIYVSSTSSVDIVGTTEIYGTMLAPQADVNISGTAQFYGLFMADNLDVSGTAEFHTDSCLSFDEYGLDLPNQNLAPQLVTPDGI